MSKYDMKKFGNNLKRERRLKGLSQEKLGELIGKSRNYVGMVERAELNISISVVFVIAKALKIKAKDLFDF